MTVRVGGLDFREVVCVDFEFSGPPGEQQRPICVVAHELVSGKRLRIWEDDLRQLKTAPYPTDPDCLFVAYYASAEIGCHLVLGWEPPERVLDLYTEFRSITNGKTLPSGSGLIGALTFFGLDAMGSLEKEANRKLALRGGPRTPTEMAALLDYCEKDVEALVKLLPRMVPRLNLGLALLRGRYMVAAARMEHRGVPIDVPALLTLRQAWPAIQDALIRRVDADYGVFDGRTFKAEHWATWLAFRRIPWPRLPSGRLALDDDTFREMARVYPEVAPIRELRVSLSQMRLEDLAVGADGRNRCLLSAFRAKTGRNQPSNTRFIFGPAVWLRGIIRPEVGCGLAYIDWCQQEFAIAAALSGDSNMMSAYASGDPYLMFAKQAGAAPSDATKQTHNSVRELFKACALAVQYGMGAESLAQRIGQPIAYARELLRLHHETYPQFWRWSDAVVDYAMLRGQVHTVFGWQISVGSTTNARSLRNFPMQANGAEMLRLACCLTTERGIAVCAPIHDAILIEAPVNELEARVEQAHELMAEASRVVLAGFELRSEAKLIQYPERYQDPRGARMWQLVWDSIAVKGAEPETRALAHL